MTALDSITKLLINSLEDDKRRLDTMLMRILEITEIIPLNKDIVANTINYRETFGLGCQDSLVFSSIISHLDRGAEENSCFLNRNSKDFDDSDIVETLENKNRKMLFSFEKGFHYLSGLLEM